MSSGPIEAPEEPQPVTPVEGATIGGTIMGDIFNDPKYRKPAAVAQAWQSVPLDVLRGDNAYNALQQEFERLSVDKDMANDIARRAWAIMAIPEVVMGTRIEVNDQLIPEMISHTPGVLESMFGTPDAFDFETVERGLVEGPLVSEWITLRRHEFRENEKNIMWMALAAIQPKHRETVVALAEQWLRANPLTDESSRLRFLSQFYNWSREQQTNEFADDSALGAIGNFLEGGLDIVTNLIDNTIVKAAVGPDEFRWRNPMSLGQNIAIGLGVDPSDEARFRTISGSFDFIKIFAADPLTYAFGIGIAVKMSRSTAMTGRLLDLNKLQRGLRVAVPWSGRQLTNLPRFSRGPVVRVAWSLMAKSHEALLKAPKMQKVFKQMHEVMRGGGGIQELVELWPQLRGSMEGVGQLLASPRGIEMGPEWYENVIRLTSGPGLDGDGIRVLETLAGQDLADARGIWNGLVDEALVTGDVRLTDLLDNIDGVDGRSVYRVRIGGIGDDAQIGEWGDEVGDLSGALLMREGNLDEAEDGAVLLFRTDGTPIRTMDLTSPQHLGDMLSWLAVHPGRAGKKKKMTAVNRLERAVQEIAGDGPTDLEAFQLVSRIGADPEMRQILFRFTEARGYDMLGTHSSAILTPQGSRKVVRATHRADAPLVHEGFAAARMRTLTAEMRLEQIRSGSPGRTWFIKDMPTRVPFAQGFFKRGWQRHGGKGYSQLGSRGVRDWWGNMLARNSTRFMNPKNPGVIAIDHGEQGAHALGVFLRRLGVSRTTINRRINQFVGSARSERYHIIREAIIEAAEEIDHPLLQHEIIQMIDKQGLRAYAYKPDGTEWGLVKSRTERLANGQDIAVPVFPSHLTGYVQLPGQEVFTSLRRFQRAGTRRWKALPGFVTGVPGSKAHKGRATLIRQWKAKYPALAEGVPEDYLQAMAFGMTRPSRQYNTFTKKWEQVASSSADMAVHGMGLYARAGARLNTVYSAFHSTFSVMQLAMRPISWPMRVLLEEQWRAAFFDQPSLFRNPVRQMSGWYDSYLTSRVGKWRQQATANLREVSDNAFLKLGEGGSVDEALEMAEELLPGFREGISQPNAVGNLIEPRFGSVRGVQASFEAEVTRAVLANGDMGVLRQPNATRQALRQTNKLERGQGKLRELGFDMNFDWSDIHEIRNKGFAQLLIEEAASGVRQIEYAAGMTGPALYGYGSAYSRVIHQAVNDGVMGTYGLGRAAARAGHGSYGRYSANYLVRTQAWTDIRTNVHRTHARALLENPSTVPIIHGEAALADWYLVNIVDPHIDNLFKPLWGDDLAEQTRIATELRTTKGTRVTSPLGQEYRFSMSGGDIHTYTTDMRTFVDDVHSFHAPRDMPDAPFPKAIAAFFEARYIGEGMDDLVRPKRVKRIINHIMAWSGDNISQAMNRRPAYLSTFKDNLRHYRALGFSEETARIASHQKAVETVNYIFYNMENVVPFLKSANKVSPFFSAWWEVAQTWAYKIPMMSAWGIGYPMMVRKVDRFMEALENVGVLRVEAEIDPQSGTKTHNMYLLFGSDADTGNEVGDMLSRVGYAMWKAPVVLTQHMANILSFGKMGNHSDGWDDKNEWRLSVGSPVDPFSHGLGAVNQVYAGTNPLLGLGATKIIEQISEAVDYKKITLETEQSLTDIAGGMDQELGYFLHRNRERITLALGDEMANRLWDGSIDPSLVMLPAGTELMEPNTNMWMTLIENMALPFGRIESDAGPIWGMTPSWTQQMFRAFGLWKGGSGLNPAADEESANIAAGFINLMQTPQSRASISGELITQLQHLEATDVIEGKGMLTRVMEAQVAAWEVVERSKGQLLVETANGEVTITNPEHPFAAEFHDKWQKAQDLSDEMLHRATSNAAGAMLVRGGVSLYSPATPQMLFAQSAQLSMYYFGRDLVDRQEAGESLEGIELPSIEIGGEQQHTAFLALLQGWMSDPRGDINRKFLRDNFPELWPFVYGKSYWGPAGEPPEITAIDDYSEQMRLGMRDIYPPDVWMQRVERSALALDREVTVTEAYGITGHDQTLNILNNWYDYSQIKKDYDVEFSAMDAADEWFNDGAYLDWRGRNMDDAPTLLEELNKFVDNVGEIIDELVAPTSDVLEMSVKERKTYVGQLRATSRELRTAVREWEDDFESGLDGDYRRERDRLLAQYFDGPIATYYDGLADLYEIVDTARDTEDRSRAYDAIRAYENQFGMQPSHSDAIEYPSPLEWRWNSLSPEAKEQQGKKWVVSPPEWLSLWATQHVIELSPLADPYLPDSIEDTEIYQQTSAMKNELADMFERGEIGQTLRNKASQAIEQHLLLTLESEGRQAEIQWRDWTPAQRLFAVGELPRVLEPYIPMVNAIRDALTVADLGNTSDVGRRMWGILLDQIRVDAANDPYVDEAFAQLGELLYDEVAFDSLVMKIFAGETFSASEL